MSEIRIAITQPNRFSASETFIRNHIKHLGEYAEVHNLSGGWIPFFANEKPIFPAFLAKAEQAFAQILLRREFMQGFTARAVAAYLRKQNIQIVLAEYGPSGVAMLPICKRLGIPLVVHFHGLDAHGTDIFKQYGEDYKAVFDYASAVIGVSTHMCKRLVEMGCAEEKVHHVACGIDEQFLNYPLPKLDNLNFIATGRLIPKKAPHLTIQAFAATAKTFDKAHLYIVGAGELMQKCEETIEQLGLQKQVTMLGIQPHQEVLRLLQSAYCFVQHSITAANGDSEGTPVAVLEAGAMGIPIVATQHAGIADVIENGKTGFLVDENDVDTMSDYLLKLAHDKTLAHEISKNVHAYMNEHHSAKVAISKLWIALKTGLSDTNK